ncbi:hypothetical protein DITRI_Ditri13aG0156700 [Diplodiscus trichospermus]
MDLSLLRAVHWGKAKWQSMKENITEITQWPNLISVRGRDIAARIHTCWTKPVEGSLKFNVDGSALGQPGPAGIGGVLRDHKANIKLVFSKSVDVVDSNLAELLAIREAFLIFSPPVIFTKSTKIFKIFRKSIKTLIFIKMY